MKILITGLPGSGKSIFARYLHSRNRTMKIIDIQDYSDISSFESDILSSDNCIVVIQHSKFFLTQFIFDRSYTASRISDYVFSYSDGFIFFELNIRQARKFFHKDAY